MNPTKKEQLKEMISLLVKSNSVFMEYINRFESSWSVSDKEEAMVMLGEIIFLKDGFEKALAGSIIDSELESIYSLIPVTKVIYEELIINVSEWLIQDDKNNLLVTS